jgi:TolB-like protein
MTIWFAEIKELETLYKSLQGHLPDLEKELEKLTKADDENMVLLYARRSLEVIITDLCECELKRPRKTEPLKGIIDKLNKEQKVPSHIFISMDHLNTISAYGAHPKDFDPRQIKPVLNNLTIIIEWYQQYKDNQTISQAKPEESTYEGKLPADSPEVSHKPQKGLIFLISGLLLVVVIIVLSLFVFDIFGGKKQTKEIEKSIAVLPFKLLSDEPDKQYLADGMMDAILLHLSKIEDLRVMSRTSVEQYRETGKTMTEIGRELGVSYLMEGSFQKYGDNVRLIVQLIKTGREGHLWANEYDRNWNDIFSVQSEVAQTIARELDAVITPEEKQTIEKIPTTNLTAYDFYQQGREELVNYRWGNGNKVSLIKAENLYQKALEYDSTFAGAYSGLAMVYRTKYYSNKDSYYAEIYLDSVMILANRALTHDDHLAEAYYARGLYYCENAKFDQAIEEFDKATKYNPNYWEVYLDKTALVYANWDYNHVDYIKAFENLNKAIGINHGKELPVILNYMAIGLTSYAGFEKGYDYYEKIFKLTGDTNSYLSALAGREWHFGNREKAIELDYTRFKIDSNNIGVLYDIGYDYMMLGHYKESLKYFKKYIERLKTLGELESGNMHRIGYVYWQNGYKKESEYYFNECKRIHEESIKKGRQYGSGAYYDLAGVYAFMGEKEKAYENLKEWASSPVLPFWWIELFKEDPLFDSIRNEPEFQQIQKDVEAKYQAEHERVGKWLEEQGIL